MWEVRDIEGCERTRYGQGLYLLEIAWVHSRRLIKPELNALVQRPDGRTVVLPFDMLTPLDDKAAAMLAAAQLGEESTCA